ncbi:UPF0488 protein C8orf33 homolog isoform X2 [Pseudoliparis swirei]|uniref:UPF0488 protein C8orf33 homolog isoform X2 n=1 Tax=Pseudoliparis swirei TaxID=2059687 RepID=UPI0024BE0871|nr:UPF0488 protein C8orf33 homolog isoform X2 [Pseudoliparis swirei]
MTEERLLFIAIEPKSNRSGPVSEDRAETLSDNTFRFNFLADDAPALQEETFPPSVAGTDPGAAWTSSTGQGSAFTFHFDIPPVEDMETTETRDICSPISRLCVPEETPARHQEINSPAEPSPQSKAKKKKKKSGKKNLSDSAEAQQTPSSAEGSQGGEDPELSAEEQLNRQLDWCIEQLESGMGSQRATPKQKEEASRSLKTLRSAKAPLAKKRQVMRAMTGDYRKKMDEEKSKQYKLIQNEMASAKVKVVSNSPKKSSFHRRAEAKKQTPSTEEDLDAAHLDAAHLHAAHLDAAHLDAAHLHAAHLDAAHLDAAHLDAAHLHAAHLDAAHLDAAHLHAAHLHAAHLDAAHLHAAHLDAAHLDAAHLDAAHLHAAHLDAAHLDAAHLDAAHLDAAHLHAAHLDAAHLDAAHLHAAHLHAAHLDAAHLDAAHLDAAHLHAAHLDAAHLHAAPGTHLEIQTQEETPAFVFTSSKEEFHFNFL